MPEAKHYSPAVLIAAFVVQLIGAAMIFWDVWHGDATFWTVGGIVVLLVGLIVLRRG